MKQIPLVSKLNTLLNVSLAIVVSNLTYIICLFQPQYSYVSGDGTVPAESAMVLHLSYLILC